MIKFYIHESHESASEVLQTLLWSKDGFDALIDENLHWNAYGTELRYVLVGLYVEGEIPVYPPETPRVGNVSRKDKSLRIDIKVEPERLLASDPRVARGYLIELIASALRAPLVRRRKWDFDFERLASDFESLFSDGYQHNREQIH
jgi:hypothetical protein